MKPENPLFNSPLKEGESRDLPVMLLPKKCYTVIGIGLDGIEDLDLQIVAKPPNMPPMPIAARQIAGREPVIAAAPRCFKNPSPLPVAVTLMVKALRGSGRAIAQLLVK
jgi:hypothetical protein